MAPRTLPGLGLQGYAPQGETNWNGWADPNWRLISALLQGRVDSILGSLPVSGVTDGDMHIITSDGSINLRDNGAWVSIAAQVGWRMFDMASGLQYEFDGTAWVAEVRAVNVVLTPPSSVTPANNGEVMFELTDNTTLTFKVKGSDGTVRSGSVTLA